MWTFTLSPDRRVLAIGGQSQPLQLWDTSTWRERPAVSDFDGGVGDLCFTPDSRQFIAVGYRGKHADMERRFLQLCDTASGEPVKNFTAQRVLYSRGLLVSPTGERALLHISDDNVGTIQEWELATGKVMRKVGPVDQGATPNPLAWSPDGRLVAVTAGYAGNTLIEVLDAKNWKVVAKLPAYSGKVNAAIFTSDSKFLVSGSDGRGIIWDLSKFLK